MTKAEFKEGFMKFMLAKRRAEELADALCTSVADGTVQVINGEECAVGYDDDSVLDEDGSVLSGISMSPQERRQLKMQQNGEKLLSINADMFSSYWMREFTDKILSRDEQLMLYGTFTETKEEKAIAEIATAVCAILRAFPDNAAQIIQEHVKENPLYCMYWDKAVAVPAIRKLLPEEID